MANFDVIEMARTENNIYSKKQAGAGAATRYRASWKQDPSYFNCKDPLPAVSFSRANIRESIEVLAPTSRPCRSLLSAIFILSRRPSTAGSSERSRVSSARIVALANLHSIGIGK